MASASGKTDRLGTHVRSSDSDGDASRVLDPLALGDAALSYMGLEDMLGELLDRVRRSLGVDTAAVLLLDEERGVLVARAARGLEEEVRQGVQVPLARGFAGRVAAGNRPIIIDDLDRAEVVNPILRQRGIGSMLGVPLRVEAHVIGVMHIGTLRRRDFNEDDVALLQLAADRAARAIDEGRIAEQRSVTSIMQRTLLPDVLPEIPGIRFSAKYLPAGSGVKVGGDWYDVFWVPGGRLAFVIGDVVGRGVLAASVMAEIRTTLRAYLIEGHSLAKVASLLNALMISMGRNRAATLCLMDFDLETAQLEVLTAGHLPPLMVDADGASRLLEQTPGLPVGIVPSQQWTTERYHVESGSTLLLYTDGLVERRGEPIDVGLERLKAAGRVAALATDASFADRVYRAVLDDDELDDDVALLAIESLPLGDALELTLRAQTSVLAGLRAAVTRWLAGTDASESDVFDIVLSTSEAAANAVQHAYGAYDAAFSVHAHHRERSVTVAISDRGRWRTNRPLGGGRGLEIIRCLMDTVTIAKGETGTTVTITKTMSTTP
jgi:serine phosphatase RsbU (regulator of sigma subunit)/anti-sigma regulatory factor (Ser/Thr protein kinase)